METILKFLANHIYISIIAVSICVLMLIGFIADLKRPKRLKQHVDKEDEMQKKIYELKNSPLANTTLNKSDNNPGLKM